MTDDIAERLRSLNRCIRCGCQSCASGFENHDHICTDGPGCVRPLEKRLRAAIHLAVQGVDRLEAAEARIRELEAEVSGVSAAIGTTRFMDPPDGGSVTLSEQVARMRQSLDAAEGRLSTIKSETIERCAKVADKHRAHVPNHDPEMQSDDLVAQGYGNAAFNIATAIRQLAQEVKHEAD